MMDLSSLLAEAQQAIAQAAHMPALEQVKARFLGKKGLLTERLKQLGQLPAEERPHAGQLINAAKEQVLVWIEQQHQQVQAKAIQETLQRETLDVTLPGRTQALGSLHPVTLTRQRIESFFIRAGFEVAEGPEIEDEFHNFEALNIPKHHPARALHDTFYLAGDAPLLLRTHTSSVQIREMVKRKDQLPLRLIAPGRVYRCDSDLTHTPMFHQLEGLVIE